MILRFVGTKLDVFNLFLTIESEMYVKLFYDFNHKNRIACIQKVMDELIGEGTQNQRFRDD